MVVLEVTNVTTAIALSSDCLQRDLLQLQQWIETCCAGD